MTLNTSQIKAILFDVDGTLSDTDDLFVQHLTNALSPIRFIFPNKDPLPFARKVVMATETPGNFLFGLPDKLGIDDEIAAFADFLYRRGLGKEKAPFLIIPGVLETLKILSQHYPLCIVSARGERSTHLFLQQFNLFQYFRCIITAQTCEHTKPYPDPILYAAEQMGLAPKDCVMVGDTTVDILAAKRAKAQAIGVLCGFGKEKELQKAGAGLIIKTTSHLKDVLLKGK